MNVVRRVLVAAAVSGTALGGVATVGATAAQAAAHAASTTLSIKAPHAVTYGTQVTVDGKLRLSGHHHAAVQGATITLWERATPRGKWTAEGTGTTDATGMVSITSTDPLSRTEEVRLSYPGSSSTTPATKHSKSTIKTVKVRYAVSDPVVTGTASPWTVSATVTPANNHARVALQMQHGKRWVTVRHAREDASGNVSFTVKKAGTYRVVKPAAHRLLRGVSASVTIS